jgi:uncharacterized MAPEG superfamily protein
LDAVHRGLLVRFCGGAAAAGVLAHCQARKHGKRSQGRYDNHEPRAWLARQNGASARANAAQANSFEALPFFMGAVIIAHQLGAGQTALDAGPAVGAAAHVLHLMYVADMPLARSMVWGGAFAINIAIFFLGYR